MTATRWTRPVRSIGSILGGVLLAVPLGFVAVSPIVPVPLRTVLAALWLAALLRPRVAILLLMLLAPFGAVLLSAFGTAPIPFTEALVVAVISGTLIDAGRRSRQIARARSPALLPPMVLFGGVVLCSLAAVLAVSQVGLGIRWPFIRGVVVLLSRDYLLSPPGQWASFSAAAGLVEGMLLLWIVLRDAQQGVGGPLPVMRSLVAAGGIAAALVAVQATRAVAATQSIFDLPATLLAGRFSVHVTDANAAGSFFAMTGFLAAGLAMDAGERGRLRVLWGAIAAFLVAALWLSGSRTAVVAVVGVLVIAALAAARGRSLRRPLRALAAAAVVVAALGALAVGFDPRAVARRSLFETVSGRAAFAVTGLQMMAAAPVFGAGIGRYFEESGRFMPQSIYWFHFHENAHNNFLQVGGELGTVGLAAFVWLLITAAVRLGYGLRTSPLSTVPAGAVAGLGAFVITWLAGHPLLTPEVAVPFWMLAGGAIAAADRARAARSANAGFAETTSLFRGRPLAIAIAMVLLIASVPLRAGREAATLNLAEQTFGFYEWEGEPATGRFRWTTPSAAFFVAARTNELDIPMCAAWADHRPKPTIVTFAIDGRVFHRLETRSGDWTNLRLRLPPPVRSDPYRRVDVTTEPAWSPAVVLGTLDSRVLGVQLGTVTGK